MLWYGSRLRDWVREGGRPELNRAATGRVRAFSFDACARLQAGLPTPPLAAPPVIIAGLWRTGTTLLHEMLACVEGFVTPTTWQSLRPASFRLVPPGRETDVLRPMDGLRVSTHSPQEDEFALLLLGAPSLYRGFLDPRRLAALADELLSSEDRSFLEPWLRFLGAVQAERPGRLLLKSPNHLFRLDPIRTAFPDAHVILTLRNPVEVYWSNLRMWRDMAALHGHWPAPDGAIETFVVRAMAAAADRINRLSGAPLAGVSLIQFEDLVADPESATLRLLERLGLSTTPGDVAALRARAASADSHIARTGRDELPPEAARAAGALSEAMARLLRSADRSGGRSGQQVLHPPRTHNSLGPAADH